MVFNQLKTLLYITNYAGNKNAAYLNKILTEFDQMNFLDVTVIIYTTEALIIDQFNNININVEIKPKQFSNSIYAEDWQPEPEFIWLHRFDLVNKIDQYDLFIHLEDDILFTEDNVKMFLDYANDKFEGYIIGHVIYEQDDDQNILPQFHMQYRDIDKIITVNGEDFFVTKNNHQASWMASNEQLKFLFENNHMHDVVRICEPYNIKCSAVSEIYSTDLLKKIIPVDKFEDGLVRHLSNKYISLNIDPSSSWFNSFQTKQEIKSQVEMERKLKNIQAVKEQYLSLNIKNNSFKDVSAEVVIGVPIYNEEKYIESTLNSLYKVPKNIDVKFFIIDNKSTDNTFEIAKYFANKDDRFIIHQHEENLGAAENFNYVYNNSNSPYFMWLGGHDQISPSYIKKAKDIFDQHEDAAYVAAEPYAFYDDTESAAFMEDAKYLFSENRLRRYMESVATLSNCTIVNSMFRRDFLKDLEFRTTIGNDHVLISHLLWQGKIYYIENEKYFRRFFHEERGSRDERMTANKTVSLDHFSLIQYYIDDFKKLYNQPGEIQDYLCQKMLMILENRFQLENLDHNKISPHRKINVKKDSLYETLDYTT